MIIHIDDRYKVADLQDRFSECFPFLKIEFYRSSHKWKQHSVLSDLIQPTETIGSVRNNHEQGILEIKSWYQTGRVEKDFKEKFGLNIQIYRKRNNGWTQTISTDNLTLREQHDIAAQSAKTSIRNIV